MSASHDLKNEIITQQYKSACCRRAFLSGVLFAKGETEGKSVTISLEKTEYADFVSHLIREIYNKEPRIFRSEKGGRRILLAFDSTSAAKYIESFDVLSENFTVCDLINQRCSSCLPAFLKGVFLASGRFSNPKKRFSLEFTLGKRVKIYTKILTDLDLKPLVAKRKTGDMIYFRNSYAIEDFYGYAGINHAVFEIIETQIARLARRESQRYLNCVTNNYNRMSAVANRQVIIIQQLEELNLLSSLPEELEKTARMRIEYPDLPLSMLAAQMSPAISKSGLSHRLKKIEEIGEKLLNRDTKK